MTESEKEIFKCAGIKCIKLNKLNGLPIKNTVELCNEYIRMQSILKRIADLCKAEKDKGFVMSRYGTKEPVSEAWDLASEILELLEKEGVDENRRRD